MTHPRPIQRAQRTLVNNSPGRTFPPDPPSSRARPWSPAGGRELALTARPPAGFSLLPNHQTINQKDRAREDTLLAQRYPLPGNSYFWRTALTGQRALRGQQRTMRTTPVPTSGLAPLTVWDEGESQESQVSSSPRSRQAGPIYPDAAVEQRRREDAKAENNATLAISPKSETFTVQVNRKPPPSLPFASSFFASSRLCCSRRLADRLLLILPGSAQGLVNEVSVSQQLARRDRHFLHAGNNPERANAAQAPAHLGANLRFEPAPNSATCHPCRTFRDDPSLVETLHSHELQATSSINALSVCCILHGCRSTPIRPRQPRAVPERDNGCPPAPRTVLRSPEAA